MFTDLTDTSLQPLAINNEVPEIILSERTRGMLQNILEQEDSFARVNPATSVVKPDSNSVFFSNHWYYLAVLCKKYAQALYPYCVFFDNRIRNSQDIVRDLAAGRTDNPQFNMLFDNEDDKYRMLKFIQGDTEFRPGKALINIRDGNRATIRSCKDIFGSCVLKKIAVPDASSGYLGNVIYYLAKHGDVYDHLEEEVNAILQTGSGLEMTDGDILNHTLYGIHIKNRNDALSEDRPHICIGWSKLGDLSSVEVKSALEERYKDEWPEDKARTVGQNVGQIWRFINDAKVGDYVIYADGDLCHIGRITSEYYHDSGEYEYQDRDYVNVRDVIWLKKNIRRTDLSEAFHRSLMTAMSFWTMNDYRAAAADLLRGDYVKDEPFETAAETFPAVEQKERFREWMTKQKKANGDLYSANTINSYISQMDRGYAEFDKFSDYSSIFEIQNGDELAEYKEYLFNAPGFDEFNERAGNKACSCGIIKYGEFLSESSKEDVVIRFKTSLSISTPRNCIVFGAPGTGKSYRINEERKSLLGEENESDYERVTFHPDYSYANFVGTYKPVPCKDENGNDAITYEYVPGPFMRVYVKALKNAMTDSPKPFLLIIEEINRANVAAVFGDVFQLLDRDEDDISEYPIQASEDIKKYLARELDCTPDKVETIKIPDNMFIWATMNSADQGVYPMDTAFKRRWEFLYIGIDDNDDRIRGKYVTVGSRTSQRVEWNKLRKAINNYLSKQKINEDKQLGPYFISRKIVIPENGNEIDRAKFADTFKSKVIMYLFEDAAKQKRPSLFEGCFSNSSRYSDICREFDEHGIGIFNRDIIIECEAEDLIINNHRADQNEEADEE